MALKFNRVAQGGFTGVEVEGLRARFASIPWGFPIVEWQGRHYIALSVLTALQVDPSGWQVKIGRRLYALIDARTVEEIWNSASYRRARENSAHLAHQQEVAQFAAAISDLASERVS